jgi:hypothetical protein
MTHVLGLTYPTLSGGIRLEHRSSIAPSPLVGEGPPLMRRPSADTVAGNGAPLNWRPSADAVAGNGWDGGQRQGRAPRAVPDFTPTPALPHRGGGIWLIQGALNDYLTGVLANT